MKKRRQRDMKLLVILLLVGHGVLGGPAVYSETETTTPLKNNEKEEIKNTQAIDKLNIPLPYDKIQRPRKNHFYLFSDENYEENPKRGRDTDSDYLKQFLKEILMYKKFKHLYLRDSDGRNNHFNLGINKGDDEYKSSDVADVQEPRKSKRGPKQGSNFSKDKKNSNVAMKLAKYLQQINENKDLDYSKENIVNKEADMLKESVVLEAGASKDLVNRIILGIKRLLTTQKGKSELYVSRILNIIRKNEDFLVSHRDPVCRVSKLNYLTHSINTVYQRYLMNAECEGEYLDTGLDIIGWIVSNRNDIKAVRDTDPKYSNNDAMVNFGEDESNNDTKDKKFHSFSDYSSSEARFLNSLENKRNKKTNVAKRSLPNDDGFKLKFEELKSDKNNRDLNKQLLNLYIKSHLLRDWGSMILHKSDPYHREIEKLFAEQENADTGLFSIRQVCEKIASAQFLKSVEVIIQRLLHNTDCKPENALKKGKGKNKVKPAFVDLSKQRIHDYSIKEPLGDNIPDFNHLSDEGSQQYSTDFHNDGQSDEDKQFIIPISKKKLKNKQKHFRDDTRLGNNHLANLLNGLGKFNSLKPIKQKLNNMNDNDYKKIMINLPAVENVLKIIYKKFPPQLQSVWDLLKTGGMKIIEDESLNLSKIPFLLTEAFLEGKGKDLLKMMAEKLKNGKLKAAGTGFKKFRDKTRLRNEPKDSNLLVNQDEVQTAPEQVQLDRLPHIEVPSGIENTDQPVVELTYVFNHPPEIHYKPKFYVKHNITYGQYLENIKSIYNNELRSSNNQIQLLKVVKKEGNVSEVFYETEIPNEADDNSKMSNKTAMLKLYEQFYNSTENNERNVLTVDNKNDESNNELEIQTKVLKSILPTASDEIYSTDSTVSHMEHLTENTKLNPKDEKEDTANVSKNNEFGLKLNNSNPEEVIFVDAHTVETDNTTKPEPQLSSEVYIGREGKINWNQYPINRPKYNNKRKRSIKWQKVRR